MSAAGPTTRIAECPSVSNTLLREEEAGSRPLSTLSERVHTLFRPFLRVSVVRCFFNEKVPHPRRLSFFLLVTPQSIPRDSVFQFLGGESYGCTTAQQLKRVELGARFALVPYFEDFGRA